MIIKDYNDLLISPARSIKGKVELFNGSTLANTFNYNDALSSIVIERNTEGKFFGFGICQKAEVKLRDKDRLIEVNNEDLTKIYFSVGNQEYINNFPDFYVTDVKRDENTNELTITAYDKINEAGSHKLSELGFYAFDEDGNDLYYSVYNYAIEIADFLGMELIRVNNIDSSWDSLYKNGANFSGEESFRDILNDVAEATQSFYYVSGNKLIFKRLDRDGEPAYNITKASYFTLTSNGNRTLSAICSATELGDNIIKSLDGVDGFTQYVRENGFWDLSDNRAILVEEAVENIGGLSCDQYVCKWRGNFLLELGDKITITAKDDSTVTSYLLDDKITYNGGFSQESEWSFTEDATTKANPTSLGEKLNQTIAKVDKANKEIQLAVSEVNGFEERMSSIEMTTSGISASVKEMEQKVSTVITAEDLSIAIENELANGVEKVTTTTGFVFNEEGLTVSKSGSEMTTTITEDGMKIYRNEEAILVADNEGVKAEDLHATTYLIIGENSRFEDYSNRTGCFWIGK